MMSIPAPTSASDYQYLQKLCDQLGWQTHHAQWKAAYSKYRLRKGNPWQIPQVSFVPDISAEQKSLYGARSSSPWIASIRHMQLQSCPMCGSSVTGSVDHFLPKEDFPELSLMAANLVPACFHCNSGAKRQTYKGASSNERFVHPYFDAIAAETLWLTKIIGPYAAARFEAIPLPSLDAKKRRRIEFHLRNVLGPQFHRNAEVLWSTYPQNLRNQMGGVASISMTAAAAEIGRSLMCSVVTQGKNCWNAAFFRGLQANAAAQAFVVDAAQKLQAMTI
ncbi:HNH endonuclease [Bradyrhizobium canariense]|uniref:HNH domain-containing protein n=1 Tax=Bradyrhizobium canariense TaxID=255045 RepID=A0A1X3HC22_9BRAD|nr:HNH endonuclease signature motif containing protein [Bradyrhizobium canariense]OSI73289.1 hypothetical protein BSZ22_07735 [Bradyrhizobium canariense]OSI79011.1 hypothetical protein BSZ23_16415 [Bradyrhizobium canariense]OSI89939.1 hypothetical protein BSZ25_19355 [Bradyrhizobium canariense]OSI92673.1 hypothetical protein BSZ24_14410 [Bradyrhizobium canariense]OSJ08250.1 hypothetical protein BSZ16_07560 [Bradyrhizobium canariense]